MVCWFSWQIYNANKSLIKLDLLGYHGMQPPRVTLLVWEAAALGVLHGKARRQFFFLAELLEALGKFKATSGSCLNKSLPGPQSDRAVL